MFRTEVVRSYNFRKTRWFKIVNFSAIIIAVVIVLIAFNSFGTDSAITLYFNKNYNSVFRPVLMGFVVLMLGFSIYTRVLMQKVKRLGSLEMDEKEIRYLEHDKVLLTISTSELKSVELEFFSTRMRNNPSGCMNYITFYTNNNRFIYEIVILNSLTKSELGDMLRHYRTIASVNVKNSIYFRRLFSDRDFK